MIQKIGVARQGAGKERLSQVSGVYGQPITVVRQTGYKPRGLSFSCPRCGKGESVTGQQRLDREPCQQCKIETRHPTVMHLGSNTNGKLDRPTMWRNGQPMGKSSYTVCSYPGCTKPSWHVSDGDEVHGKISPQAKSLLTKYGGHSNHLFRWGLHNTPSCNCGWKGTPLDHHDKNAIINDANVQHRAHIAQAGCKACEDSTRHHGREDLVKIETGPRRKGYLGLRASEKVKPQKRTVEYMTCGKYDGVCVRPMGHEGGCSNPAQPEDFGKSKFSRLQAKIERQGNSAASARRITAAIGRRAIGSHAMAERAAASRKKHENEEVDKGLERENPRKPTSPGPKYHLRVKRVVKGATAVPAGEVVAQDLESPRSKPNKRPTRKPPGIKTMQRWSNDGVARATDGCKVEPDGSCPHGHKSWLLHFGYI